MDVRFSPEQEAKLSRIAHDRGTDATQLVKDAALCLLSEDERFRAAVREGIASADHGDFISHEKVWLALRRFSVRNAPSHSMDYPCAQD